MAEVIGMSDRVIILKEGQISGEFTREEGTYGTYADRLHGSSACMESITKNFKLPFKNTPHSYNPSPPIFSKNSNNKSTPTQTTLCVW